MIGRVGRSIGLLLRTSSGMSDCKIVVKVVVVVVVVVLLLLLLLLLFKCLPHTSPLRGNYSG